MPKRLIERCRPDSVLEFRAAARQRFLDGLSLAEAGRRTAAIYLWGYAAEMTLKAAFFGAIGFPRAQTITMADLRGATASARGLGFSWAGNLHNLESWARLLVNKRASLPQLAYPTPGFGGEVEARARRLQHSWGEFLRYHRNIGYLHEVKQVRDHSEWLLIHSSRL